MALDHTVRTLAAVPTFADLDLEALKLIAFSAEMRILRAGDLLFHQGDVSDCGYVLLSGTIALEHGRKVVLAKAPVLIGNSALICETLRPATAVAREPSSVLRIARTLFRRVVSEYPDSAARLRDTLAGQVRELRAELGDVAHVLTG